MAPLRPQLEKRGFKTAAELAQYPKGHIAQACGIIALRQQPDTGNGVIFISLEDESGVVQVISWKSIRENQRVPLLHADSWASTAPGSAKATS